MPVSPQDYELYSRATGTPLPQTPQERALLAPDVYRFTRSASTRPSLLKNLGKAAKLAGGAALIGLTADYFDKLNKNGDGPPPPSGGSDDSDPRLPPSGGISGSPIITGGGPTGGADNVTTGSGPDDWEEIPRETTDTLNAIDRFRRGLSRTAIPIKTPTGQIVDASLAPESPTPGEQLNQPYVGSQTVQNKAARIENNALIDNNSTTINEANQAGGAITPTPAQGISTSATTNLNIVNPLTHGGQFLQVDPSQQQTDEGLQEVPRTATFRPDVQLGMPAPLRPWMQNLGQDLSKIWNPQRAGFQFLDQGAEHAHHGLLGGIGGALATAGLDASMPEIGIPVHLARMAGGVVGGLGPLAGHGIRGLETIGTVGKAVAQQAAGDVMDTLRIGAHPAGQAARWAIRKGGRDIERGIEDVTKYGPDILNRASQGLGLAAKLAQEKGERDWALSKGLINAAGERINRFGVEIGEHHLANDNPDTPGEEQDMAPSRSIHEPVDDSGVEQINDPWDSDKESSITSFRSSPSYKSVVTGGNDELVGGAPQEVPSPIDESISSTRDRSTDFVSKLLGEMPPEVAVEIKSQEPERSYRTEDSRFAEFGQNQMGDPYVTFHEKPTKANPDRTWDSKRYSYPVDARTSEQITNVMEGDEEGNIFDYFRGSDVKESDIIQDVLKKAGRYEEDDEGNWTPRL